MDHVPERPAWNCKACGEPWPCERGRKELAAAARNRSELASTAWNYLEKFCFDQPDGPAGTAFMRFVSWTWPKGRAVNAAAEIADFEAEHPGWRVSWCDAGKRYARRRGAAHPSPFEHPAGYVAEHARRNVTVCAATLGELDAAIEAAPAARHWMHRANCCALSWG